MTGKDIEKVNKIISEYDKLDRVQKCLYEAKQSLKDSGFTMEQEMCLFFILEKIEEALS